MKIKTTVGQYYPVDSPIHRLDPRVKLLSVMAFIILLFVTNSFSGYGLIGLFLLSAIRLSRVPLRFMLRGIMALKLIILFTFVINVLFGLGEQVLIPLGFFSIYLESVLWAFMITLRFIMLIVSSSLLTLTTSPMSLTSAIETLLAPFKKIRLPVHEIAMMMTIALRFIPTLIEETDKITKAQMSRGADFDQGKLLDRVKSLIPVLIPLFVSAFRRADELAMAMDARCYRGDMQRTKLKELTYTGRDWMAYGCMVLVSAVLVAWRFVPV